MITTSRGDTTTYRMTATMREGTRAQVRRAPRMTTAYCDLTTQAQLFLQEFGGIRDIWSPYSVTVTPTVEVRRQAVSPAPARFPWPIVLVLVGGIAYLVYTGKLKLPKGG